MDKTLVDKTAGALPHISKRQIEVTLKLLDDGNTVPFIARYRKERTGNLDEVQIRELEDTYKRLEKLSHRKTEVIKKIDEEGQLTSQLKNEILNAESMQMVEDLYLPYKQKRKTKATVAKEHGLEPLAAAILHFRNQPLAQLAQKFVNNEQNVDSTDDALDGAHEIIADAIGNNAKLREWIRNYTLKNAILVTKVKTKGKKNDDGGVYSDYYDFSERAKAVPSYRILAINRGEKAKVLNVKLDVDVNAIIHYIDFHVVGNHKGPAVEFVKEAGKDAYKRFIGPAIEREIRSNMTDTAEKHAIEVFGRNLYHLLMQAPIKGKVVLGFDPAYRTGCKLAVIDASGKFLTKKIIKATKPATASEQAHAKQQLIDLIKHYHVEMIAIGNGTASRESEQFVADAIKKINYPVHYVIVNEAGASVYSASNNARKEFPDLHVEERSAISIGRRLQDPLAELIKIDPKAVGVGQYQHDVSESNLDDQLDRVIETAVNQVGVNLNTASPDLLEHVSGLSKAIAQNIVTYRDENGMFSNRNQLKKVKRLGPKAFEQSVGFLRIINGKNSLDNTDIHPESYPEAKQILSELGLTHDDFSSEDGKKQLEKADPVQLSRSLSIDQQLVTDILTSLKNPGRDQRDNMPKPLLKSDVMKIDNLRPGMKLQGTVRNVTDFGAFVDIGVKQDGLVHISKMSHKFISDPAKVVSVGDIVDVWVLDVDLDRKRIQLSMVGPE
ncbi:Tex family protein [Fructilactobacillus fructivorans]|uniref:S1 RNA-binding domain-containing protein n=1 Tax=Fructilactobacillus fructivorans TaxID=1614 RepID=A0AAE6P2J7_9LACO|nr:Tex family protein [Fructilactobacillus fructivorans]KRK57683.1 transcription accessory protein [Fructilactobacillus fructivorans]KRN40561.1 transcription accessory protein [Fructilactobacillus fructivorans]KRN42344.1 transcription accessory protein [Fructilactobacillus fructivorans]QFX93035.1 S1 RNA-binding domain-containing protein [Fructilactobacillus fructivorans]RDV65362.1 RNA-binding transcriptional accessory protein [Fructilactobacillus fructivorans]